MTSGLQIVEYSHPVIHPNDDNIAPLNLLSKNNCLDIILYVFAVDIAYSVYCMLPIVSHMIRYIYI